MQYVLRKNDIDAQFEKLGGNDRIYYHCHFRIKNTAMPEEDTEHVIWTSLHKAMLFDSIEEAKRYRYEFRKDLKNTIVVEFQETEAFKSRLKG